MLRMDKSRLHRITRPKAACESCSEALRGCESPGQSRVVDCIVSGGYVEVARVPLEHDADTKRDFYKVDKTHTHIWRPTGGCVELAPMLLENGTDTKSSRALRVCTISRSIRATSTHPSAYAKCSGLDFFEYRPGRSTPSVVFGRRA